MHSVSKEDVFTVYGPQFPHHGLECDQRIPKSVSMGAFNDRYTYSYNSQDDYLEPVRPGSPTVLRIPVPIITMTPPQPSTANPPISKANLLSVPENHANCYKIPPESDFDLCEDVFQEHQARLVNCDSEDASASLQRVLPKTDIVRITENFDENVPDWFHERLERMKERFPGQWVPLSNSKTWKSDIYLSKNGEWEFNSNKHIDSTMKRRSVSVDCILDSSSSECDCMVNSRSPQSTDSQQEIRTTEAKNLEDNVEDRDNEIISKRKLSSEEQEKALKELDDIVSGISKITEFANRDLNEQLNGNNLNTMNSFLSTMLSDPVSPKTEVYIPIVESSSTSSSSNGDFEYGTGRVAALAKHFSQMGAAGIIRGRADNKRGLRKGAYKSEPNLNMSDSEMSPKPGDIILPPAAFVDSPSEDFNLVLGTNGLKPVGFSMDRLIDLGHGVIMREMKCDIVNLGKKVSNNNDSNHNNDCSEMLDVIVDKSTQTSPLKIDNFKELSLSETALYEKNNTVPVASTPSLPEINLVLPEPSMVPREPPKSTRAPKLNLTRKSISVDEVEMRRRSSSSSSLKHYSLVDLGEVDTIVPCEVDRSELQKTENPSSFCPSESIHHAYSGDSSNRMIKRWMSVDDSFRSNGWSEKLKEKDKLDFGNMKDSLRRKCKADVIKGRKLKRIKKLELQRSFVVTPIRLHHKSSLDGSNSFWSKGNSSLDGREELVASQSRKL